MFEKKTTTFQVKIFATSKQICSKNFLALSNVSLVPWVACGTNVSTVQQFGPTDFSVERTDVSVEEFRPYIDYFQLNQSGFAIVLRSPFQQILFENRRL